MVKIHIKVVVQNHTALIQDQIMIMVLKNFAWADQWVKSKSTPKCEEESEENIVSIQPQNMNHNQ